MVITGPSLSRMCGRSRRLVEMFPIVLSRRVRVCSVCVSLASPSPPAPPLPPPSGPRPLLPVPRSFSFFSVLVLFFVVGVVVSSSLDLSCFVFLRTCRKEYRRRLRSGETKGEMGLRAGNTAADVTLHPWSPRRRAQKKKKKIV